MTELDYLLQLQKAETQRKIKQDALELESIQTIKNDLFKLPQVDLPQPIYKEIQPQQNKVAYSDSFLFNRIV